MTRLFHTYTSPDVCEKIAKIFAYMKNPFNFTSDQRASRYEVGGVSEYGYEKIFICFVDYGNVVEPENETKEIIRYKFFLTKEEFERFITS
jgi:hypothetical protein